MKRPVCDTTHCQTFKGTRAGDLPIERPATFEVALNLRTARSIGLSIAPALRLRATEIIE